jgi:Cu/Ag efflux protein CusF
MRVWVAAVLLNAALLAGAGWGYLWWGRRAQGLEQELARLRAAVAPAERQWTVRGVVRAVLRDQGLVVLSHEEIPGYMAPMTMGFRLASPRLAERVQPGDVVRFTLRGTGAEVVITAMEREPGEGATR